jgi:hypothetical protein
MKPRFLLMRITLLVIPLLNRKVNNKDSPYVIIVIDSIESKEKFM